MHCAKLREVDTTAIVTAAVKAGEHLLPYCIAVVKWPCITIGLPVMRRPCPTANKWSMVFHMYVCMKIATHMHILHGVY